MKKDEMRINDTLHKLEDAFDEHWNSTVCKDSSCIFTSEPMKKILKAHDTALRQSLVKEVEGKREQIVDIIDGAVDWAEWGGGRENSVVLTDIILKIILQEKE